LSLAIALDDCPYSLVSIITSIIILGLSINSLPPSLHYSVDLILEGSLVPCRLPLLASREVIGVWLGKGRRKLKQSYIYSSK
jgi:hypothetical protein